MSHVMTDEQKKMLSELTPLQRKVAINVTAGMSNIDAYYEADGKAKTKEAAESSVSRMLSDDKVATFVDSMNKDAVSSAVMTRQEMLEELSMLARTNQNDLITWGYRDVEEVNSEGNTEVKHQSYWTLRSIEDINPDHMKSIEEVSVGKDGLKFKKVSKLAAMKQLADIEGYNKPQKIEQSGVVTSIQMNKEEYAEARKKMIAEDDC